MQKRAAGGDQASGASAQQNKGVYAHAEGGSACAGGTGRAGRGRGGPSVPVTPPAKVSADLTKMPSQMEHAMETMMFTFHKFAGEKGYLTKEDLRVLMEKEFPGFLENQKDPLAVDKIMKDLDQCRDGRVGFQSFFSLIAGLTIACNDYFVLHMKQKGKK
ncbi:hypothetical protein MUG91_G166n6 [Manis pentadactyla]|nr:hypothetical protein MUG91_G166n6 [Manis pentadactyla]